MAQNITLLGGQYPEVPAILLPKTGGGTAQFDDTTILQNAAAAADITNGKKAFVNGALITGTNSGGGGSNWTLIGSKELSISSTSTSNANKGDLTVGSDAFTKDKIIWVRIRDKAGARAGYMYGTDTIFLNANKQNGSSSTYSTKMTTVIRYSTSSQWACYVGNYGVYAYSISSAGKILIYARYNSTNTLTINGTYLIEVYELTLPNGKTIFE